MTTTLITGANKGLGRETARQLIIAGHNVWIGARDEKLGKSAAEELGGRFVQLDVTDDTSVNAAVALIESAGGLDVLVNNAGIERRLPDNTVILPASTTADDVATIFETNVFGLVRVTHAFLPLLERSPSPVIVNVSSGLGSLTQLGNHFYPGIAYPASKTAVNAITVQFAKALPRFRINAADPGFTNTDLNGRTGTQTVEEGAEIIVQMALIGADGTTGAFLSARGPVAW